MGIREQQKAVERRYDELHAETLDKIDKFIAANQDSGDRAQINFALGMVMEHLVAARAEFSKGDECDPVEATAHWSYASTLMQMSDHAVQMTVIDRIWREAGQN